MQNIQALVNRGVIVHHDAIAQTGSLSGQVCLQGRSDHSGATVSAVIGDEALSTITSSQGTFTLATVPEGTHSITVELPGFLGLVRSNVEIVADQNTPLPNAYLFSGDANDDGFIDINDLAPGQGGVFFLGAQKMPKPDNPQKEQQGKN